MPTRILPGFRRRPDGTLEAQPQERTMSRAEALSRLRRIGQELDQLAEDFAEYQGQEKEGGQP